MSEAAKIRAVVFAMDGVLIDSEPLLNAAAVAMFKERGLTVRPEDLRPFVGAGDDRYLGEVAQKYNFPLDTASARKRLSELYLELVPSRLEAFPGAVEVVRACKQAGLKIAVASSADRRKTDASLKKIGLPPEEWDAIASAEDRVHPMPGSDRFLEWSQKLGLAPEQCVVIEDTASDVQAAKAAGMRCVAVARRLPAAQFQAADLVRGKIADISLSDLTGPVGAGQAIEVSPPAVLAQSTQAGPWGLWATLGLGLVIAGIYLGSQIALLIPFSFLAVATGQQEILMDRKKLETNGLFVAFMTCGAAPVAVGMSCLFALLRRGTSLSDYLGLKPASGKQLFRWCLALMALAALSDGLTALLGRPLVPHVVEDWYKTAWFPPLLWLAVVVLAPLSEEVFFRGFLFAGISHSPMGGVGAILLTSFLWAVIHIQYDWYGVASIFAAGLLLGYARLKTGSIVPTILMHTLMNLAAMVQVAILTRFASGANY